MVMLILGLLDVFAGIILVFSPGTVLPSVMKIVGSMLITKGVWSIVSDVLAAK